MIIHYILLFLIAGLLTTAAKGDMITNYKQNSNTKFFSSNIQGFDFQPLHSDRQIFANRDSQNLHGTNVELHFGIKHHNGFGGSLFYKGAVFDDSVTNSELSSGGLGASFQYNWHRLNLNTSLSWNRVFHQIKSQQTIEETYNPSWDRSQSIYHKFSLGLGFTVYKSNSILIILDAQKNLLQFMDKDFAYHAPNTSHRMQGNTYGLRIDFLSPFSSFSSPAYYRPYYSHGYSGGGFNHSLARFVAEVLMNSLLRIH